MDSKESKVNFIAGICIAIFGLLVLFVLIPTQIRAVDAPWFNSPKLFPYWIGALITGLGVALAIQGIVNMKKNDPNEDRYVTTKKQFMMSGITILSLFVYTLLLKYVGYIPPTIVLLAGLMRFAGQKNWIKIGIISVVLTLFIYFAFSKLLLIRMP